MARASLDAGATLVNDVTALRGDPLMASTVAERGADCCLMHMLGEPRTMQRDPRYDDVVDEVKAFLHERMEFAVRAGIAEHRLLLDPGIGFGKTVDHNLQLLAALARACFAGSAAGDRHLAQGLSRAHRRRRRRPTQARGDDRLQRARAGARSSVFRVHEVAPVREALAVAAATLGSGWTTSPAATSPTI